MIGLGSLVPAFFFLVLPTPPRLVLGQGWSLLFVCFFASVLPTPSTQYRVSVWVIEPLT